MRIEKTVSKIVKLAHAGVAGVHRDTYMDQVRPDYIVLETSKELAEFRHLVAAVREAPRGTLGVIAALEKLEKFVGRPCLPEYLTLLYDEEKGWRQTPESLLDDEFDRRLWEEDADWFTAQRGHFAERDNSTPIVPDEPWRGKVVTLATEIAEAESPTEIAEAESRGPEEGDFNAALIRLHGEVPPEELARLVADLKAIEEGHSAACPSG